MKHAKVSMFIHTQEKLDFQNSVYMQFHIKQKSNVKKINNNNSLFLI